MRFSVYHQLAVKNRVTWSYVHATRYSERLTIVNKRSGRILKVYPAQKPAHYTGVRRKCTPAYYEF